MEISLAKIIVYVIIAFLLIILLLMIIFPERIQEEKSGEEKCKPAVGYTEELLGEHMSHHPDIYKECLN